MYRHLHQLMPTLAPPPPRLISAHPSTHPPTHPSTPHCRREATYAEFAPPDKTLYDNFAESVAKYGSQPCLGEQMCVGVAVTVGLAWPTSPTGGV